MVAAIANAVKEIASITGTFKANLIAWLGDSANGIENIFTKELVATNMTVDHGSFRELTASSTLSDKGTFKELCVQDAGGKSCYTRSQLNTLLSGSVLGASTPSPTKEAAGTQFLATGAPAAMPATTKEANADTATTTTPFEASSTPSSEASLTPVIAEPANDNPRPPAAEQSSHDDNSPLPPPKRFNPHAGRQAATVFLWRSAMAKKTKIAPATPRVPNPYAARLARQVAQELGIDRAPQRKKRPRSSGK